MAGRLEEPSLSQIVIVCKNSCSMALEAVQPAPQSRKPACLLAKKFWLCPETWGIDPLRHRFKILVNMSRLARSQVEKAFFRNATGNVQ